MNHEMGLYPENFETVKSGQKRWEYRLYDEKRQNIRPGDTITFYNTESNERVTVLVESLQVVQGEGRNIRLCGNQVQATVSSRSSVASSLQRHLFFQMPFLSFLFPILAVPPYFIPCFTSLFWGSWHTFLQL